MTPAAAVLFSLAFAVVAVAQQTPGAPAAPADATAPAPDVLAKAKSMLEAKDLDGAQAAVVAVVEADPDHVPAHTLLREIVHRRARDAATGKAATKELEALYVDWRSRFPKSFGVQFGLGALYSRGEDPRARPFLLEAVRLRPDLAEAWQMLSIDAERWGEGDKAREYMQRAAAAAPDSPDYAFYAASNLREVDRAKWKAASLDVAKRFPQSERGAQALYWLAVRATSDEDTIAFAEQARTAFPPQNFRWTRSVLPDLFEAYLRRDPPHALELARELAATAGEDEREHDEWTKRATLAEQYLRVKELLAAGDAAAAAPIAAKLVVDRFSGNQEMIALLQAEVKATCGDVQAAYDALLERAAKTPEDATAAALGSYGERLGKTPEHVAADVRARRDAQAKPAPDFVLQRYDGDGTTALADYRGKVVLLTFWFPGCGPCRGEFPNFEHVIARFAGKDVAYVGINGVREQDEYVRPFLAGTKYSFTPLGADEAVTKAYGVRGYPANFLIDREGRIVFRNFRIDDHNELLLQRMIEALLAAPAPAPATISTGK